VYSLKLYTKTIHNGKSIIFIYILYNSLKKIKGVYSVYSVYSFLKFVREKIKKIKINKTKILDYTTIHTIHIKKLAGSDAIEDFPQGDPFTFFLEMTKLKM
jgi:hypothetical protein